MLLKSKKKEYDYIEKGDGEVIMLLHGLMGGLSNFEDVINTLSSEGYRVVAPELPIYTLPLISTNVRSIAKFLEKFLNYKEFNKVTLLGNSLGGHVGLMFTKLFPERVQRLILTGSSGLYENSMGDSYPRRGDYEFVEKKTKAVFYNPDVATKELVDEVFETIGNRNKVIKTLAIAKSAIRHNMANDLSDMNMPSCLVWGKNDTVTPPEVAEEFHKLLPNSDLYWIDKCGHAAMMEQPQEFNQIVIKWLKSH